LTPTKDVVKVARVGESPMPHPRLPPSIYKATFGITGSHVQNFFIAEVVLAVIEGAAGGAATEEHP
jgi:hypothetical protein